MHRDSRKIRAGLQGSQDLTIILRGIFFKRQFQSGNKKNFLAYPLRDVVAVLRIKTIYYPKTFHLHDKYFYATEFGN